MIKKGILTIQKMRKGFFSKIEADTFTKAQFDALQRRNLKIPVSSISL